MKGRTGFLQETMIFSVLMVSVGIFALILAPDAPSELESLFSLLKNVAFVGVGLIPVVGAYFAYKTVH